MSIREPNYSFQLVGPSRSNCHGATDEATNPSSDFRAPGLATTKVLVSWLPVDYQVFPMATVVGYFPEPMANIGMTMRMVS